MVNTRTGFHRLGIVIGIALSFSWLVFMTYMSRPISSKDMQDPVAWIFIVISLLVVFLIGYGIFAGIPWLICWIIEGFKKGNK